MLTVLIILDLLEAIAAVICLPIAIINKDPLWITLGIIFAVASIAQVILFFIPKRNKEKGQNDTQNKGEEDPLYNDLSLEQIAMIEANKDKGRNIY